MSNNSKYKMSSHEVFGHSFYSLWKIVSNRDHIVFRVLEEIKDNLHSNIVAPQRIPIVYYHRQDLHLYLIVPICPLRLGISLTVFFIY